MTILNPTCSFLNLDRWASEAEALAQLPVLVAQFEEANVSNSPGAHGVNYFNTISDFKSDLIL